ncbi:hypothetical protein GWI33_013340 [Rhynchophorus ferrugineus]|uniref:Phospholipid/glycerol acyltransferase domain-containing protein n=1 Tax=Rhynchophorus ferrugineus TaxID=354439 RepID=A0A834I8E2_RHYFE|nr:hypothetical protein GWI33_013340 [Rhynchophorus ferrugineus]
MVISSVVECIGVVLTLWIGLLILIIIVACFGKSLGIKELYVQLMLKVFEFGKSNIEEAQREKRLSLTESEDEGYAEENVNENEEKNNLISRDNASILLPELTSTNKDKQDDKEQNEVINFNIGTWLKVFDYSKTGIEAIIEDQVTSRFQAEELKNWNLLTRTQSQYEFISWKLTFLWIAGFFFRYCFLFPLRLSIFTIGFTWLLISTTLIGKLPDNKFKRWLNFHIYVITFRILTRSLTAVIKIHNKQWRPPGGTICVANHTSPIDCIMLSTDNCYSLIGQRQGGILGILQRALNRASPHVWFERSEAKDRHLVLERLKNHTANPNNPPMLIFPEGTCINNTSVMQFKKGSFEVGCPIHPVAIKYDPRFGDAFWNSSKYGMGQYIIMMMTSWALVCEIWYLPPTLQEKGETSIEYANRVKHIIAKQGGLVDLVWDGQLKRTKPKKEWKERQQEQFSKLWKAE